MINDSSAAETVMQDFVFGALEADDTILAVERQRWSGLHHEHAIAPLNPLPGQPVTLTATVGRALPVDQVTAYFTSDGSAPSGRRGQAINGFAVALQRVETTWQPLYWDYAERWQGQLPGQPAGTHVRYVIEGWRSQDDAFSHPATELSMDGEEQPVVYGYHVDRFQTPAWAYEAVVYQVFVDRFAPAPRRWLTPAEMEGFVGGTLRGVIDQLDYIAGLGVSALWLTPIFACHAYHGYDVIDYFEVDPRFGSKADLAELVQQAHTRGLRVILDFVANHISDQAAPFQAALTDPASPYRRWFDFDPRHSHGYRTFFGVASMPQLQLDDPDARGHLLDAARYWLREFGVDGYRLDFAAGPSHDFWSMFGAACKTVNPDCWLFGEVTLGSDWLRTYAGRLDGCLDFSFTRAVRRLCATPASASRDLAAFAAGVERAWRFFPLDFTHPCFIDNHDMNRFLWVAGNDKSRLRLAAGLLFAFGGSPILYYGTEVGLSQPRGKGPHREEARHPMLWGADQDADLLEFFRGLIRFRRRHPALWHGQVRTRLLDPRAGLWLAERVHGDDHVVIGVNLGSEGATLPLPGGVYTDVNGVQVGGVLVAPAGGMALAARRG